MFQHKLFSVVMEVLHLSTTRCDNTKTLTDGLDIESHERIILKTLPVSNQLVVFTLCTILLFQ
jgi:hypothetical protein